MEVELEIRKERGGRREEGSWSGIGKGRWWGEGIRTGVNERDTVKTLLQITSSQTPYHCWFNSIRQ